MRIRIFAHDIKSANHYDNRKMFYFDNVLSIRVEEEDGVKRVAIVSNIEPNVTYNPTEHSSRIHSITEDGCPHLKKGNSVWGERDTVYYTIYDAQTIEFDKGWI